MDVIIYLFFRFLVSLLWIMPFRLIYIFSDFGYLLIYRLARYRKKTVIENLTYAFPEKSTDEILHITRKFYKHLSDLLFEGIKGMSMSREQVRDRHKILNVEILDELFKEGKGAIGVTAHYGNWEWGAFSSGVQLQHTPITIYKPLNNKYMDAYMRKLRQKYNCNMVPIKDTYRAFSANKNNAVVYILIADQKPHKVNPKDSLWINFLNQDTVCLQGPEKLAKLYNLPVYNIDIKRVKRGYYTLYLSKLVDNPKTSADGEITTLYMKALENKIIADPAYWLWSHRRWKHKREHLS